MSQRSHSRGAASRSSNTSRSARPPNGAYPAHMTEPPEPRNWCCECYDPSKELLEYDYTDQNPNKDSSAFPRIRERGEYYIDSFNDQPWSWTFGTHERVRLKHYILVDQVFNKNIHAHLIFLSLDRMEYGSIHRIRQEVSCRPWCGFY